MDAYLNSKHPRKEILGFISGSRLDVQNKFSLASQSSCIAMSCLIFSTFVVSHYPGFTTFSTIIFMISCGYRFQLRNFLHILQLLPLVSEGIGLYATFKTLQLPVTSRFPYLRKRSEVVGRLNDIYLLGQIQPVLNPNNFINKTFFQALYNFAL